MAYFESDKVKQIVALSGIALLGGFLFITLSGFIPALLGSVIFYVICSPLMKFFIKKMKLKKWLAALLVIVLSFLVILVPLFSLTYILVNKLSIMFAETHGFYSKIEDFAILINSNFGINILTPDYIVKIQNAIAGVIPNLLSQTLSTLFDILLMYFVLFYLLITEIEMEKSIVRFLPYTKENAHLFAKELTSQTYSNVIGAPLLSLIQGCFAALGFWLFGLNEPIFWGMACGFLSMMPILGSALVWLPAAIIQASTGAHWQGIAIAIYGLVVIVNVDNIFRFIIQKKIADVHPLVTVFGVIIGVQWFGIPGIIFGPLLISYFLIMIKIYRTEYGNKNFISATPSINKDTSEENSPQN
jgi:predicted PurR-regulated permease PerM